MRVWCVAMAAMSVSACGVGVAYNLRGNDMPNYLKVLINCEY